MNAKQILFSVVAIMLLQSATLAQAQKDNRTLNTRIADLLVQFPASDAADLERLMRETAALGHEGILEMARMFKPQGKGNNTNLEYALGGFSFFVMQEDNEALRAMASEAFADAAAEADDPEVKKFFIRQLQKVGKDEAVSTLKEFLLQEGLCGPAARALVSIDTPSAHQALLEVLPSSNGACKYSLIEALGDVRYKPAVGALTMLANSDDINTRKLALYALANIGDPASGDLLSARAEAAAYKLEETNATASFLLWAKRMSEAGETREIGKLSRTLLKKLDQKEQVHTKTAALKLLVEAEKEGAMKEIVRAATDDNPELRAAAREFAAPFTGGDVTKLWLKQLKKADPEIKAEIITFLGKTKDGNAYEALIKEVDNENKEVMIAAIVASASIGEKKALPILLEKIRTEDEQVVDAVKNSLLSMEADLAAEVAQAIPATASPLAKAALIAVLSARRATDHSEVILDLLQHENTVVRKAAFQALPYVTSNEDLPNLYDLLIEAKVGEEVALTQSAIINVHKTADKTESTKQVMEQMKEAPAGKKHLYYSILANIGTGSGLQAVVKEYWSGNEDAKEAAVRALSDWPGAAASYALLDILRASKESTKLGSMLEAFVSQVTSAEHTDQHKYLLLREGMEMARTSDQKKAVLKQIGTCMTFPALMYAGEFFNDAALKSTAAHSVLNIALDNPQFYGKQVRELLARTMDNLKGRESTYLKQSLKDHLDKMPGEPGFVSLFNGKDLSGWKGLVGNPIKREKMSARELARAQAEADKKMRESWVVEDGKLIFTGKGDNISTENKYGDFEMYVDWKIYKDGDAGIYLRGTPQVQIWDTARVEVGAQVGSGGLYNNKVHESKPLKVADNPVGEWNSFHIIMKGEYVTVYLNGQLVVDRVILENYWDREQPIFPEDYIELQAHGTRVEYRDLYVREIPKPQPYVLSEEEKKAGFSVLFDGTHLNNWQGNKQDYVIEDGNLVVRPKKGSRGDLFTKNQYEDFIFRFEFRLTPGANNGLGIRSPLKGDPAYQAMELQILDNTAEVYKDLHDYQYHGSVYGVIPARRGYLKPVGEWNYQEVIANGPHIKVILNGHVIVDGNIEEASANGTRDGKKHPGLLRKKGHIGFLGHGSVLWFRNIRIKSLDEQKNL